MEASDISRITYELIRQHDDRLLMKWEDDRGHMMKEITRLKKRIRKDEITTKLLKTEINKLCESFHEAFEDDKLSIITQKRKMQKIISNSNLIETTSPDSPPNNFNSNSHSHSDLKSKSNLKSISNLNSTTSTTKTPTTTSTISTTTNSVERYQTPPKASKKIVKNETSNLNSNHIPHVTSSRNRFERDLMRGHECQECMRYYRIMEQQGLILSQSNLEGGLCETLRRCSRHKSHWSPPSTPDGFWDLTVHTPEEWKNPKKSSNKKRR